MIWFHVVCGLLVGYLGYHFGEVVKLEEQWPYFEALRTTTSIVFGVMGALLAIVFPDVLKVGLGTAGTHSGERNLRRVLLPCANSAILLIVLVVLAPVFAWLKSVSLPESSSTVRQSMFCLFCILTYWQVVILQMVLLPLDTILANTSLAAARARLLRAMHTNGRG